MYPSLEAVLGWRPDVLPAGQLVVVADHNNQGDVLLHHFIGMYLKGACWPSAPSSHLTASRAGGHPVCLVGLAQTLTHYASVAKRLVRLARYCSGPQVFHRREARPSLAGS